MSQVKQISPVYGGDTIATRIRELGRELRADAGSKEIFLLGILRGASVFLADLLRVTDGDVSYGFIDVVREGSDNQADATEIDFLSYTDIRDRHVYLLKDVVVSGVIETYLLTQLRTHAPATLRLVALLDRPNARTVDLKADFCAFTVEEGVYAGYGLEQDGHYGNLPWIGRVE